MALVKSSMMSSCRSSHLAKIAQIETLVKTEYVPIYSNKDRKLDKSI